ncbi:MAG: hypothetical protein IT290_05770 [Deltaproteobacteria bacterium]|nr:hypothetical protein [Deltaproteobacteria bacterium]
MGLRQLVDWLRHPATPDARGPELVTRVGTVTSFILRMHEGSVVEATPDNDAPAWLAIAAGSRRTLLAFSIPVTKDWRNIREKLQFAIERDNGGVYHVYPNIPALLALYGAARETSPAQKCSLDLDMRSVLVFENEPPDPTTVCVDRLLVPAANVQEFVQELRRSMWNICRRWPRIEVLPSTRPYSYTDDTGEEH